MEKNITLQDSEILKLPTYQITSDLDKWILAELHKTLANVDEGLRAYASISQKKQKKIPRKWAECR